MKQLIGSDIGSYGNITPNSIDIYNIPEINEYNLLLITNITKNVMIFNFADPSLKATVTYNSLNNIHTINFIDMDLSTMLTDIFQIFIDIPSQHTYDSNTQIIQLLLNLRKILEPIATQDSNGRQRVVVESSLTVSNTSGLGYTTTTNTVGGNPYTLTASQPTQLIASIIDQRWEFIEQSRINFNTGIRSKLIWE